MLRTLGFLRRQVGAAVPWQASTIGFVGIVVGVPVGLVVGRWAWVLVADGVGVANDPRIPITVVAFVVPLALFAVNLVGAPFAARATRVPAAVALRTE